jgi:hypothetical protein
MFLVRFSNYAQEFQRSCNRRPLHISCISTCMYTSLNTQRQHAAASVQIFLHISDCIKHAFDAAPRWLLENLSNTLPRYFGPMSAHSGSSIAKPRRLVQFSLLSTNGLVLYSFQTIRRLLFTQILLMKFLTSTIPGFSKKINTNATCRPVGPTIIV